MAKTVGKKSKKVRVAIIGVGNCASSLVQGVEYYKDAPDGTEIPGIMHTMLGGYHIGDIEFSAAIDIDAEKVGKDLSDAIFSGQNNTYKFATPPKSGIKVARGMTHDGLGKYLSQVIKKAPGPTDDIVGLLRDTKTDVVISYLPVGSEEATKWYVEQVLRAGCAFVNCIPVFIAREKYWQGRFEEAGLPIIGDDIKSQVGATITHRVLTRLFEDRGVRLDRTYQLNFGGNTDFMKMLERERLELSPRRRLLPGHDCAGSLRRSLPGRLPWGARATAAGARWLPTAEIGPAAPRGPRGTNRARTRPPPRAG